MIQKHQSSIITFLVIYLTVTLIVGGALFILFQDRPQTGEKDRVSSVLIDINKGDQSRLIPSDRTEKTVPAREPEIPVPIEKSDESMSPGNLADSLPEKNEKVPPAKSELDEEIEAMFPLPKVRPLIEIVGNWKAVPQKAFPPFVFIHTPVEFELKRNGAVVGKGKLPPCSSMIPLQSYGEILELSSSRNSNFSVMLPMSDTDFRERIQAKYDSFIKDQTRIVLAQREAEKERRAGESAHESAIMAFNEGEDPRFDPLKASIRRGEAGFFQIESARRWRWAGSENIDEETYQTAFVMMVSESAFGTSERELKALIQHGEVVDWIDVSTGEKI